MKLIVELNHTREDIEDVFEIEKNYLDPSTISSVEQVLEWESKNNDIQIFVKDVDAHKVVGELTILPLTQNQFELFMQNELEDTMLSAKELSIYISGKEYYLLFSAIAIHKDYRENKMVLSLLLHGFYEKLTQLLNNNIIFLNMCAEGQTRDGRKFIESFLNLKKKKVSTNGYTLYSFNNKKEFDNWLNEFPKYIKDYDNKYKIN